jgi:kynurenine 3-monooxygenase
MIHQPSNISIIGAGLVGTLLAIALKKLGYQPVVFDKRPQPIQSVEYKGRSINLALSDRGLQSLQTFGLDKKILNDAIAMKGRMIHKIDGSLDFQPYHIDRSKCIYSISRASLNKVLVDDATNKGIEINFESEPTFLDIDNQILECNHKTYSYDFLFAADGAYSSTRLQMKNKGLLDFTQSYLDYGYKELEIIPNENNKLEKNALHIWPRKDFMFIALPNQDGSFTGTLFLKLKGENSFEELDTANKVRAFFEQNFLDAIPLIQDLEDIFLKSPVGKMVTVNCNPWTSHNICLLGDAAHAIVPFYGQGMNAGFEGVHILHQLLLASNHFQKTINQFAADRPKDTDAIAQLALYNFLEMRDLVSEPSFLMSKQIEVWLKGIFPSSYQTVYEQVTFSHTPYRLALESLGVQKKMFEEMLSLPEQGNTDFFHQHQTQMIAIAKKHMPHL